MKLHDAARDKNNDRNALKTRGLAFAVTIPTGNLGYLDLSRSLPEQRLFTSIYVHITEYFICGQALVCRVGFCRWDAATM